jgi:hypothetical protein
MPDLPSHPAAPAEAATRTFPPHANAEPSYADLRIAGQVTKLRKKAADGLCPCCDRHFADLQMHLASKHPDFKLATA